MAAETVLIEARPGLPRPLPLDALRAAVAATTSWRGVMRLLGFTTSRSGRVLRGICDEHGVDYAHFRQSRVDLRPLAEVVATSSSWNEVLQRLGYAPSSGTARATARKHCRIRGIDTSALDATFDAPPGELDLRPQASQLRHAGPFLVAAALAFGGVAVSFAPEGVAYDLLGDFPGSGPKRIQVKTVSRRSGSTWQCTLARKQYSRDGAGGHRPALYSREDIDFFACVTLDRDIYLIPVDAVEGRRSVSLRRLAPFRIPSLPAADLD